MDRERGGGGGFGRGQGVPKQQSRRIFLCPSPSFGWAAAARCSRTRPGSPPALPLRTELLEVYTSALSKRGGLACPRAGARGASSSSSRNTCELARNSKLPHPALPCAMPCWTLSTACMNTLDCLRSTSTMNTMNKSVGGWRKGLTASSLHSHDLHCPLLHHLSLFSTRASCQWWLSWWLRGNPLGCERDARG